MCLQVWTFPWSRCRLHFSPSVQPSRRGSGWMMALSARWQPRCEWGRTSIQGWGTVGQKKDTLLTQQVGHAAGRTKGRTWLRLLINRESVVCAASAARRLRQCAGGSGVVTFAAARAPKNLANHGARERQQHLIKSNFLRGDSWNPHSFGQLAGTLLGDAGGGEWLREGWAGGKTGRKACQKDRCQVGVSTAGRPMILCHDGICHPPSTPPTLSPLSLGSALYSPTVTSAEGFSFSRVYTLRRAISAPVLPYSKRYTARRISINHQRVVWNPLRSPSLFCPHPLLPTLLRMSSMQPWLMEKVTSSPPLGSAGREQDHSGGTKAPRRRRLLRLLDLRCPVKLS